MLIEHNKFTIQSAVGEATKAEFEVAWSEEAQKDGLVRIIVDDKVITARIEDLYGFVFAAGTPEQQDNLMPVKSIGITKYTKFHKVRVNRDMKAGEFVKVRCEVDVLKTIDEGMKGHVKQANKFKLFR